jgi:hypothetical protein
MKRIYPEITQITHKQKELNTLLAGRLALESV